MNSGFSQSQPARQALPLSNLSRGNAGMNPQNVGMNNSDDLGALSKPGANAQPQMAQQLAMQNMRANKETSLPQQYSKMRGQMTAMNADQNTAEYRAQDLLMDTEAALLEKGGNSALMELAAINQSPDKAQFLENMAVNSAMFNGESPELGSYRASTAQYKMM